MDMKIYLNDILPILKNLLRFRNQPFRFSIIFASASIIVGLCALNMIVYIEHNRNPAAVLCIPSFAIENHTFRKRRAFLMECEIFGCLNSAHRASGFCLYHLELSYEKKGEKKCRNHACSNMAEYFGLCHHCDKVYQEGKNVAANRFGGKRG